MQLLPPKLPHPLDGPSRDYRLSLLKLVFESGTGHIGGSLSSIDIISSLYNTDIFNMEKDKFILSAGHLAPALYTVLAKKGKFPEKELKNYASYGSRLQGHVFAGVPGVHYSSGSLGQGLSFAAGLAYGEPERSAICLTTDGEHNEGQVWEAVMFANKYHLGNLINIIDANNYQIDGLTEEIMPLGELAAKYIRFGWTVITIDGHNFYQIEKALRKASFTTIYPTCIIAKTVFGKGVSFMENNPKYHNVRNLDEKLYKKAQNEINNL